MFSVQRLTDLYDAYVDTFRGADGELPPMMRLKREHTAHVVENARAIATSWRWPSERLPPESVSIVS